MASLRCIIQPPLPLRFGTHSALFIFSDNALFFAEESLKGRDAILSGYAGNRDRLRLVISNFLKIQVKARLAHGELRPLPGIIRRCFLLAVNGAELCRRVLFRQEGQCMKREENT